jgi:hypothetical protein
MEVLWNGALPKTDSKSVIFKFRTGGGCIQSENLTAFDDICDRVIEALEQVYNISRNYIAIISNNQDKGDPMEGLSFFSTSGISESIGVVLNLLSLTHGNNSTTFIIYNPGVTSPWPPYSDQDTCPRENKSYTEEFAYIEAEVKQLCESWDTKMRQIQSFLKDKAIPRAHAAVSSIQASHWSSYKEQWIKYEQAVSNAIFVIRQTSDAIKALLHVHSLEANAQDPKQCEHLLRRLQNFWTRFEASVG